MDFHSCCESGNRNSRKKELEFGMQMLGIRNPEYLEYTCNGAFEMLFLTKTQTNKQIEDSAVI